MRFKDFNEITSNKDLANKLKEVYNDIDNVDLYVGGLAEDHIEGGSLGELFSTIIAKQFESIRDGDRFWYENVENGLFTKQEIAELKSTTNIKKK